MAGGNKGATLQARLKGNILSYPVAAETEIFRGAAATLDKSAGGASHDITAADHNPFIGMSEENVKNKAAAGGSGLLGDKSVRLRRHGIFRFEYGRADPTSGVAPVAGTIANTILVDDGGLTEVVFTTAVEFAVGDFVVIAGVTTTTNINGTWRLTAVAAGVCTIDCPYVAGTPDASGTVTYYKSVPAVTDLGKTAFLGVAQQAAVEEQAWALQGLEPVDLDRVLIGPIVKVEASPEAYVWIDIVTGALRGCSLEFTTSVTDLCVVEGIVTFVGGT